MDFSVGNLVKSVVGAVAKVATAVVNKLSPVAKSGGILGGIAGAIVGVAEAVLGVTAEFANACEDGEIDDEEAEELLEDVFKLLVGACIVTFDSGSSSTENNDITSDHVCYIFYQPGIKSGDGKHSFDEQAEIEKKNIRKNILALTQFWCQLPIQVILNENGIIWMMNLRILMLFKLFCMVV
ncbi:hypothetical protein [Clostridium sp. ZBS12]|uniref:hypothetical protein n=1 Tax=Clostridium sp. ZBS12 TaxID=2949972 RepID=UPI00207AFF00|nr:hypothetical protein [Clostridium sp. ZBS12]